MIRHPWLRPLALVVAGGFGIGVAMLDRSQSEVQPAVVLLLAAAFVLSWFRPGDAPGYALLLGAGVPGLDLLTRLQGIPPVFDSQAGSSLLAFLPAAAGALAGAFSRRKFGPAPT